jgi:hypothetical protein
MNCELPKYESLIHDFSTQISSCIYK